MANAASMDTEIFPTAMVTAMIRLFSIITPTGALPAESAPEVRAVQ